MSALENIAKLLTGIEQPVAKATTQPTVNPHWWKQQAGELLTTQETETDEVTPEGIERLVMDESSGKDHLKVYKDSKGIHTIGHGFNLQDATNAKVFKEVTGFPVEEAMKGKEITKEHQEKLLEHTIAQADADVKKLVPNFDKLTPEQQDALTNFVFNVGLTTALKFKNTFGAIRRGDGKAAAHGIRNSAYYKQVGKRAERVAQVIETISAN